MAVLTHVYRSLTSSHTVGAVWKHLNNTVRAIKPAATVNSMTLISWSLSCVALHASYGSKT